MNSMKPIALTDGIVIQEQMAGHETDQHGPQGHLVGGDARRLERAGDPDSEGSEEPEVDPLLDRGPLML